MDGLARAWLVMQDSWGAVRRASATPSRGSMQADGTSSGPFLPPRAVVGEWTCGPASSRHACSLNISITQRDAHAHALLSDPWAATWRCSWARHFPTSLSNKAAAVIGHSIHVRMQVIKGTRAWVCEHFTRCPPARHMENWPPWWCSQVGITLQRSWCHNNTASDAVAACTLAWQQI